MKKKLNGAMVENENTYPEASPGGKLRPFTSPLERQPTVLSIAAVKRPNTCFPGTGFDAELQRLESDDPILRQMAMNNLIAMSKHGGSTERIIAMMLEKLKDSDRLFRGQAVEALSRAAKEVRQEVTTALITSLKDPDANVRIRAIKALRPACEGPSHPIVVAALSEMLCDENAFVVDATVDNLQYAIKHASFEVRHELLSSSNRGIRTAAVESFSDAILNGSDQALGFVIDMLQDQEFQVRMAAIKVIGNFLTTRDTDAQRQLDLILKADPDKQLPPAKAEGPMIDRILLALMSALEDHEPDIRSEVLRRLTCNTGTLNQKVFKTVLALLAEELEGTRNEAKAWISKVVLTTLTGQKEWAYNIVIDLLRNNTGLMQLSAALVISKVVANGNPKYLRDVVPILEAEHPLTRVAAVWALVEAVRNVVPSIMWSSSGAPTVPRCLKDPDRRFDCSLSLLLISCFGGNIKWNCDLLCGVGDNFLGQSATGSNRSSSRGSRGHSNSKSTTA